MQPLLILGWLMLG